MVDTKTEFGELTIHSVFMKKPELFEKVLGIRIKLETISHHYIVEKREIDFVLQDILDNHYIVEVKFRIEPLEALSQVVAYKKLYIKKNPKGKK